MIEAAKVKYPKARFICSDFYETNIKNYDYILCSGALNIKTNKKRIIKLDKEIGFLAHIEKDIFII